MNSTDHKTPLRSSGSPRGFASGDTRTGFVSVIPAEKRFKVEDLFKFKRGKGDFAFSLIVMAFALFVLATFSKQSMWDHRIVPGGADEGYSFADYAWYEARNMGHMSLLAAQAFFRGEPLGKTARKKHEPKLDAIPRLDWPYEGRRPRFGKVLLKSPWVMPLIFTTLMIPAAALNLWASWQSVLKRRRETRPNLTRFELVTWARALEFVAYFILYTFAVPRLGYLVSTVALSAFLTWRLGYRSWRWFGTSVAAGLGIVLVFRTLLQIKTPITIWLYDFLPTSARAFMLTYF